MLLAFQAHDSPSAPLDEALAWANLSFLGLFLAVIAAALVLRRHLLSGRDRALLALLALFLVALTAEYWARRGVYEQQRLARERYEAQLEAFDAVRVIGTFPPDYDPRGPEEALRDEVVLATEARLLRVQSVTGLCFTVLVVAMGFLVPGRRARPPLSTLATFAGGLAASVAAAARVWPAWGEPPAPAADRALEAALVSVGPGLCMAGLGGLLLAEYRRLASFWGALLALGATLYGVMQLAEIGERLWSLGGSARELYRVGMLALALALRLATVAAVVELPLLRASRRQIRRWMEDAPGGAALARLRPGRVLEVRDPDSVTARLPLSRSGRGADETFELDLKELEGAWGLRLTPEGFGSEEYLASPPDSATLFRVLLIPLPGRFLGGDHLLLTFEAESVLRILPRARLGLLLLRAVRPDDRPADLSVWWCNDHVARLLHAEPRALCGRRLGDLLHPDWRRRLDDVRRDDYSSVLAAVLGADLGAGEFVRLTACPFGEAADGAPSEMLLMMVSSLSSDSHTHIDFLLHNLAHTLRTPIQLVRGALGRTLADLAETPLSEVEERLRRIRAEAVRLEHAVDLNLQVGRDLIERGEPPARFELGAFLADDLLAGYAGLPPRELAPVVRSSRAKLEAFLERGGYVALDLADDGAVLAHKAPLEVVLRELVENALHYARLGGPPPRVRVRREGARLAVSVENEVEPAELERHAHGLERRSQGLSCVRFLSVRYGQPFHIAIDAERGTCTAVVSIAAAAPERGAEDHDEGRREEERWRARA